LHSRFVVLGYCEVEQFGRVSEPGVQAVERADQRVQLGAFAPQLLSLVGRIPDLRVFELARDFDQAIFLVVVLKDTP